MFNRILGVLKKRIQKPRFFTDGCSHYILKARHNKLKFRGQNIINSHDLSFGKSYRNRIVVKRYQDWDLVLKATQTSALNHPRHSVWVLGHCDNASQA